jgi:hypothetical protein
VPKKMSSEKETSQPVALVSGETAKRAEDFKEVVILVILY